VLYVVPAILLVLVPVLNPFDSVWLNERDTVLLSPDVPTMDDGSHVPVVPVDVL